MTANDKTGEKLVDSCESQGGCRNEVRGSTKRAKETRGQKPQPRTGKKGPSQQSSQGVKEQRGDPYQSGRRVWPD